MVENGFIGKIVFEESSNICRSPQVEHELKVATFDLLDENIFNLRNFGADKYHLHLSVIETRLKFEVRTEADEKITEFYYVFETYDYLLPI